MDQVSRSTIDFKILRNRLGLCVVLIFFAATAQIVAAVIYEPVAESQPVPHKEFDDRPKHVIDHGLNDDRPDV